MNRTIYLSLLLILLVSCNDALNKNYSALTFESDIQEMRESQRVPVEDIKLLTKYILLARLGGQDPEGKSYADLLDRIKEIQKSTEDALDQRENLQLIKRERLNPLLKVTLIKKEFLKIKNRDYLVYTIGFQNSTEKKIRTIIGNLTLEDLLEKEIKSVNILFNEELGPMGSITKTYKIDYDYSNESDQRIRSKDLTDLRIVWNPDKIIYNDGILAE